MMMNTLLLFLGRSSSSDRQLCKYLTRVGIDDVNAQMLGYS